MPIDLFAVSKGSLEQWLREMIVADESVPEDEVWARHPDGRIEKYRITRSGKVIPIGGDDGS